MAEAALSSEDLMGEQKREGCDMLKVAEKKMDVKG